jgi:Choline/ethanolamine kinase
MYLYIPTVLIFLIFLEQIPTQEHIITQWTSIQAELATFTLPQIGSISHFTEGASAIIGKLSTAAAEGLSDEGPFTEAWDCFAAAAEAKFRQACKNDIANDDSNIFPRLGPFVFKDIVHNTALFKTGKGPFHFNHMDMGTQNILVDQDFNFLAIIDWEFAQTAPWEVNHYPMPFPLISADAKTDCILQNPHHIAHRNVSRQVAARKMYRRKFRDAEQALESGGRPLQRSIADVLDGAASRIYAILEKFGVFEGMEEELTCEMVRLAYGFDGEGTKKYLDEMEAKMKGAMISPWQEKVC